MIRLFSVYSSSTGEVTYRTKEVQEIDRVPYVIHDTSTGTTNMRDYYAWRSLTYKTSTGDTSVNFDINNSNLYPSFGTTITDYTTIAPRLINIMTLDEYNILYSLLTRIDLIRRRFPNPGTTIQDTDGVGDGGVVSFAGGWDKRFTIQELFTFIEGALVEVNIHPPATQLYWSFGSLDEDENPNPYMKVNGIPYRVQDLIVQGAMIRALISWGILEVDVNFTTSDSGLSITYDRVGHVASWYDKLLSEFKSQKDFIKYDFVNSYGVGVGTQAFSAMGIIGLAAGMIGQQGVLPMNTLLGSWARGNVPL